MTTKAADREKQQINSFFQSIVFRHMAIPQQMPASGKNSKVSYRVRNAMPRNTPVIPHKYHFCLRMQKIRKQITNPAKNR